MAIEKQRGPRRRIAAEDFSSGEAVLEAAALLIIPDDQTQRQAFERFMPQLYVLKNKGCSFPQITNLLTQIGFNLQPSSVRIYYNEILAARMEMCQSRMNEQILLLAEVRKETKGVNVVDIAGRVAAIMDQQRAQVASKLDAVFGSSPVAASPTIAVVVPVATPALPPPLAAVAPGTVTLRVENKETGLRPAPQNTVAGVPPATIKQAENATERIEAASPPSNLSTGNWKCLPLPDGVKSLEKRANLPDAVYLRGDMEHPAVPGVMLSLEQRLSSVALEFVNADDGTIRLEDSDEKRFRVLWRQMLSPTPSSTSDSFTKMDMSLFKKR